MTLRNRTGTSNQDSHRCVGKWAGGQATVEGRAGVGQVGRLASDGRQMGRCMGGWVGREGLTRSKHRSAMLDSQ